MASAKNKPFAPAPENVKIDDKVVKKMVGEVLAGIDGILGAKGNLGDMLKDDADPTRGLTVNVTEDQQVTVCAKIITESGKNIPEIVKKVTGSVTKTLQNTAGLTVKEVVVEVTDTMSKEEYDHTHGVGQPVYNNTGLSGW